MGMETTTVGETNHINHGWKRWAWLAVPLLAILMLVANWRIQSRTPTEESWKPVIEHLNEQLILTDGLYIYPTWHAWPGEALTEVLRGAGHPGTTLHAHPLTALDLVRFERIWVVLPRGDDPPKMVQDCTPIPLDSSVQLCLWNRSGKGPVIDFVANLSKANVERRHRGKKITACSWKKDRHRCKTAKRMYDIRSHDS